MKRPFSETLSLLLVLIITARNALQTQTLVAWRAVLAEFAAQPNPLFGAFVGAFWTIIGVATFVAVWQRKAWAGKLLFGAATGFVVWYWGERFIWLSPQENAPFSAIVTAFCLIIVFFASKSLSREAHERDIENPKTE
ncbi:MAG: hypothetical protein LC099_05605 [Anaerolineales bacterium]|nr:hypothetical protein [Anaerolineales bacterium]